MQLHNNNLSNTKSTNNQFYKKNVKFGPKSQFTTKHHMFRATNLRQSRQFYTWAAGDAWDIKMVSSFIHLFID